MKMSNHETKIIIAGFGGQGVVVAGNIIARACVIEDKNVCGMISYGAEMRGGTANATVVISDEEIASPFVDRPDVVIIMNQPSLDKFEDMIVSGGLAVMNTSLVDRDVRRDDLETAKIDASKIAREIGNVRVANIVALGAFIEKTKLLEAASLSKALEDLFSSKKAELVEINKKALYEGAKQVVM
jgi:2-oxoglutarate ferredoxin oxidoreductase subunit gamma